MVVLDVGAFLGMRGKYVAVPMRDLKTANENGKVRWKTDIFFFNHTATPEFYTLSLHDALPISIVLSASRCRRPLALRKISSTFRLAATMQIARPHVRTPHTVRSRITPSTS